MSTLVFVAALLFIAGLCVAADLGWSRRMAPPPQTQQVVIVRRRWL